MDFVEENGRRDLWFKEREGDGWNCYFFPEGWAEWFHGLGAADPDELYGYVPTKAVADSSVDTLAVKVSHLAKLEETTREEVCVLHPRLIAHLDEINQAA